MTRFTKRLRADGMKRCKYCIKLDERVKRTALRSMRNRQLNKKSREAPRKHMNPYSHPSRDARAGTPRTSGLLPRSLAPPIKRKGERVTDGLGHDGNQK